MELFAPGKLMLFGEYGVLRGGPALLVAVNRGVTLCIESGATPGSILYEVPALGAPLSVTVGRGNAEPHPADSPLWALLEQVLDHSGALVELLGHRLRADLSQMTLQVGKRVDKLGLGSSAASCVALTAAAFAVSGKPLAPHAILPVAFDAHHAFQGGRGSGADVATSVLGDVVSFHLEDERPVAEAVDAAIPPWAAFWTGQSANTRVFIDAIRQLEVSSRAQFDALMSTIRNTAQRGVDAALAGATSDFLDAVAQSTKHLDRLGTSADVPIITEQHRALAASAHSHGFVTKPSGAGGGDFSLVFASDANELSQWVKALDLPGIKHVPLRRSPGVRARS